MCATAAPQLGQVTDTGPLSGALAAGC
jgi:hypothetical protein